MTDACCARRTLTCAPSRSPAAGLCPPAGGATLAWGRGRDIARTDHSAPVEMAGADGHFQRCALTAGRSTITVMRHQLTEDERRVLDLLSVGLPMHDIGQLLRISETLLQARVASLLRHYGADDRTSLVATAYRRGDAPGLGRLARSVALARTERRPV